MTFQEERGMNIGKSVNLLNEPLAINIICKTVIENSKNLMDPETNEGLFSCNVFLLDQADAQDDPAEITQIEYVMRLRRRRQEI